MLDLPTRKSPQEAQISNRHKEVISIIHMRCCTVLYESFISRAVGASDSCFAMPSCIPHARLALGSVVGLIRFSELLQPRVLLSRSEAARC
jgi:hypothetical protein